MSFVSRWLILGASNAGKTRLYNSLTNSIINKTSVTSFEDMKKTAKLIFPLEELGEGLGKNLSFTLIDTPGFIPTTLDLKGYQKRVKEHLKMIYSVGSVHGVIICLPADVRKPAALLEMDLIRHTINSELRKAILVVTKTDTTMDTNEHEEWKNSLNDELMKNYKWGFESCAGVFEVTMKDKSTLTPFKKFLSTEILKHHSNGTLPITHNPNWSEELTSWINNNKVLLGLTLGTICAVGVVVSLNNYPAVIDSAGVVTEAIGDKLTKSVGVVTEAIGDTLTKSVGVVTEAIGETGMKVVTVAAVTTAAVENERKKKDFMF